MGRGKRRPGLVVTHAGVEVDGNRLVDELVAGRFEEIVRKRRHDERYHPPLPKEQEVRDLVAAELEHLLERVGKASIENAAALVRARFEEAGLETLAVEVHDDRYHAEDRASVFVSVRYDDLKRAWELAQEISDELDPEELSGIVLGCGDLSKEEYAERVKARPNAH